MKQIEADIKQSEKVASPPPPPPPLPPLPRSWIGAKPVVESVTNQEISKYWMQKRKKEEEHLLAAIKAAARIRARNLSEEDYRFFVESLSVDDDENQKKDATAKNSSKASATGNESRLGIKDWWTRSQYAYLNQPAVKSMGNQAETTHPKHRTSTSIPNFYHYKSTLLPATTFGIY